jgi:hypothetical protein
MILHVKFTRAFGEKGDSPLSEGDCPLFRRLSKFPFAFCTMALGNLCDVEPSDSKGHYAYGFLD